MRPEPSGWRTGLVGGLCGVMAMCAACSPRLNIPAEAQLRCQADTECPAGSLCIVETNASAPGRCLRDGPCLVQGSHDLVADGTACGDGQRCVAGDCMVPFCGDGIVDVGAGEVCDPRRDGRCRGDCTLRVCGDGIVDTPLGESCDVEQSSCVDCTFTCIGLWSGSSGARTLEGEGDCNLDLSDGCECAPQQFAVERVSERYILQAAVRGDWLYLVSVKSDMSAGLQFRLQRALLGPTLERTTLVDAAPFIALAEPEDDLDEELFATVSQAGRNEVRRLRGDSVESLFSASSSATGVGRLAVDRDNVYGAGLAGVRVIPRDGSATRLLPTQACRDGTTGHLVSCGEVLACFGVVSGDITTIDKASGAERTVFHVDVEPAPAGGAANLQVLFCRDGRLHWHDRAAVYALDSAGARVRVAALPNLVRTAGGVEQAAAFGDGIVLAGVLPRSSVSVVVHVDVARRQSTVVMPGAFLARQGTRLVSSEAVAAALLVLDVTPAAGGAP